jgi:ABC-type multidrug transport system fused ATPase/permease subunit
VARGLRSGAPGRVLSRGSKREARAESAEGTARATDAKKAKKKLDPKIVWREARELVWAHRRRLAIGLVLMLINRAAGLVLPGSTKLLVDDVIGKQNMKLLPVLAFAVGTATVVQALTTFGLGQVLGIAAQRAVTDMRRRVQDHVLRLPLQYFDSTQTGVLISRIMNDAEGIRNLVGTGLVQLSGGIITAAVALGVLLYLNWRLTLINVAVLSLFGGVMTYAFQKVRPLFRERWKIEGEVTGRLTESLGGIRIVKTYTAEKREKLVFARGINRFFRMIAKTMFAVSGITAFSTLIVGVVGVLMMTIGGRAILAGQMTLGEFVMYLSFTAMLAAPMVQLASIGTQISEAFAGLDRIREIREMTTEDAADATREPALDLRGDVAFEDVSFEYNPGVRVLKHVNFDAPAGTTTALVGSSGSGKSTLTGLIMAYHRPIEGRVLIDGRDLATLKLREYRTHLGAVLQDNFLFDGSIAENIAFSRPNASREDVIRVSRIAHVDEFVNGFEKTYDTIVGERGVKLSGGQRQRVAIARAILADPTILILDEATSSLDSESEALIQDGLRSLRSGRTTFVIAHRLSTIVSADQILVLEGGEIVERGTHDELLARDGRYRQLYDKQYRIERDRFINPGEDFTPDLPKAKKVTEGDAPVGVPRL